VPAHGRGTRRALAVVAFGAGVFIVGLRWVEVGQERDGRLVFDLVAFATAHFVLVARHHIVFADSAPLGVHALRARLRSQFRCLSLGVGDMVRMRRRLLNR